MESDDDLLRSLGAATGWVLNRMQSWIEAAEVMNGLQLNGRADGGHGGLPMGTDHEHGSWPGQITGQNLQRIPCGTGLQGEHRRAMGNEQNRKCDVHRGSWLP